MKSLTVSLLLLKHVFAFSQAIEVRVGSNLMPGNYLSLGYEHYSNWPINFSGKVFAEGSIINSLRYKAYGIDLLGEYGTNQSDNAENIFAFRFGFGFTGQIETEPWIYGGLPASKRMTYGLVGVVSGEWWMSENFCLSVFCQQKWLIRTALGNTKAALGFGLKFRLSNY